MIKTVILKHIPFTNFNTRYAVWLFLWLMNVNCGNGVNYSGLWCDHRTTDTEHLPTQTDPFISKPVLHEHL